MSASVAGECRRCCYAANHICWPSRFWTIWSLGNYVGILQAKGIGRLVPSIQEITRVSC